MTSWQPLSLSLSLLLLVTVLTALTAAEPCLDGLGRLHREEGAVFYNFPDASRQCVIYRCVDGQKEVFRDKCQKKTDYLSSPISSKSSPQFSSEYGLQPKSGLPTENVIATGTAIQASPPSLKSTVPALTPSPYQPLSSLHLPTAHEAEAATVPPPGTAPAPPAPLPDAQRAPAPLVGSVPASLPSPSTALVPALEPSSISSSGPNHSLNPASVSSPSSQTVSGRDTKFLSAIRVSRCTGKNGRFYYEGQRWWETTDRPCLQYMCLSSQKLLVQNVTCEKLPPGCSGKFVFGKCCPESTDCVSPPEHSCTSTGGRQYQEGQAWFETDARPCFRYTCFAGRRLLVQNVTCDPPNPLCQGRREQYGQCCLQQTRCGCLESDTSPPRHRRHGEQWSTSDPCVTLRCNEGQVTEQRRLPQAQPCAPPPDTSCKRVPPPPGVCACPTYQCVSRPTDPPVSSSTAAPTSRPTAAPTTGPTAATGTSPGPITGPTEAPATRPTSAPVTRTTAAQTRPVPGTTGTVTGPTTTNTPRPDNSCEFNGRIYLNQENWQDQCANHVCFNGRVHSQRVSCPAPPTTNCAPIYQPGSCCVRWACQSAQFYTFCSLDPSSSDFHFCYKPGNQEGVCTNTTFTVTDSCCPVFECLKHCTDQGGTRRNHSSIWEESCTVYSCVNGTISSSDKDCPPSGNRECRLTNPGNCCPSYDCNCNANGTLRGDGKHWTSNCSEHRCEQGEVFTRPVPCPASPRPDCDERPPAGGRCCPEFECRCDAVSCRPAPTQEGCHQSGVSSDGCCTLYSCVTDCHDEQLRVFADGSDWFVKCSQYRCSGGNITKVADPCPPAPRGDCRKIVLPDECCPIYDCSRPCTPGEQFSDGCNHCQCFPPGQLLCTNNTCEERGCIFRDEPYHHNETWTSEANPCFVYSCRYGFIFNSVTQCPPKPGPRCTEEAPVKDTCCPKWTCPSDACPEGGPDTWEDECNICTCTDSRVVCTDFDCHKQCLHNGNYYETQEFIYGSDKCDDSICIDGVQVSIHESCQIAPNFTCREAQSYRSGCCKDWICDDLPGMATPCEPGQIFQNSQECMYCECMEESRNQSQMICTKRDCVNTGCDDSGTYHEHGAVWATADRCRQNACVSGRTIELTVQCPAAPPGCVPVLEDNRCCPIFYCGEKCEDGTTTTRGCNSCFCRDGVEFCTTKQCDGSETEDGKSESA